jgi:GT2 family glycosyltransferase
VTNVSIDQATQVSSAASLPATSLIICSRNRPKLLAETIISILKGNEVPTEIIIIDQSDEQHPSLATLRTDRDCQIRYLWTQSMGVSRARNAGIDAAQHDILAITDDDMFAAPTWYAALIRALLEARPQNVVTGQVRPANAEILGGFVPSTKADGSRTVFEKRVAEGVLYTGNMALYRSTLDHVGVFDDRLGPGTSFPAGEDNDLGFRLLEAGYRIIYVPEAVLYHRAWRSDHEYVPLRWSYGVGRGAYYAKHLTLRDRYMLKHMLKDVKVHVSLFLHRVRRERRRAYGDAMLALGILYGATRWLLTQRKTG